MKPFVRTAYSYIRFSSEEQRKGHSFDRQKEQAEAYCKENGLILDKTLHDDGVSAFHGKHRTVGALGRFLAAIEAGKVEAGASLIIENLDRLSREEIEEAQEVWRKILRHNVNIVTLSNRKVYSRASLNDPFSIIEAILIQARAHEESEIKSKRSADAWNRKRKNARQGCLVTHIIPLWLTYDETKKEFVPISERVKVIGEILKMASIGHGALKIARELNKRHVPGFRRKTWSVTAVRCILNNRSLIGEFQPKKRASAGNRVAVGDPVPNYFPAVVDPEQFDYVQGKRRSALKGPQLGEVPNLFSGLVVCGYCGSSMYYMNKGKHQYLVCAEAVEGAGCPYVSMRYDEFEESFLGAIREELDVPTLFDDQESRKVKDSIGELHKSVMSTEAKVNEKRTRVQKLMEQFADTENEELRHNYETLMTKHTAETEALVKSIAGKKLELATLITVRDSIKDKMKSVADYSRDKRLRSDPELRVRLRSAIRDIVEKIAIFAGGDPGASGVDFVKTGKVVPERIVPNPRHSPRSYVIRSRSGAQKIVVMLAAGDKTVSRKFATRSRLL
jgi:DNA invertase Pin-like site-specific DNA recombinase